MDTEIRPTTWHGRVAAVRRDFEGSVTVTSLVGGESYVPVENTYDFNPDGGTALIFSDDAGNPEEVVTYTGLSETQAQQPAFVKVVGTVQATGSSTTSVLTLTADVGGDGIVLIGGNDAGHTPTGVVDSAGNTWDIHVTAPDQSFTEGLDGTIWSIHTHFDVRKLGSGDTITVTYNSASTNRIVVALDVLAGFSGVFATDVETGFTGTSAGAGTLNGTFDPASGKTIASAGTIYIAAVYGGTSPTIASGTPVSGATALSDGGSHKLSVNLDIVGAGAAPSRSMSTGGAGWAEGIVQAYATNVTTTFGSVLVLSGTVAGAHNVDTFVSPDESGTGYTTRVTVSREGYDDGNIDARLPHRLQDAVQFAEGVYDQNSGEGAAVSVQHDGHEFVIADLLNEQLETDGTFIDGSTITGVATGGSDGVIPSTTTGAPTVYGGIGIIGISWTAISNPDPVGYEVHVSTTTGFTPDGTTLVGKYVATSAVLHTMPDNSPLVYFEMDGVTVQPYYFKIVPFDNDGYAIDGTRAGAASPQSSTSLVQATGGLTGDIAARTIIADNIFAGTVTANEMATGTITAASGIIADITADVITSGTLVAGTLGGARVELGATGFRVYASDGASTLVNLPTDGSGNTFTGQIIASGGAYANGLSVDGTSSINASAVLSVAGGVSAPTNSPQISYSWETLAFSGYGGFTDTGRGLARDTTNSRWITTYSAGTDKRLMTWNDSGVLQGTTLLTGLTVWGVAYVGTNIYVLCTNTSAPPTTYTIRKYTNAATPVFVNSTTVTGNTHNIYPGFGADGTDLYIVGASAASGGVFTFQKFTTANCDGTSHAITSTVTTSGTGNPTNASLDQGVGFASDGTNWYMGLHGGAGEIVYKFTTAGVYVQNADFKPGNGSSVATQINGGPAYDGTTLWTQPDGVSGKLGLCKHTTLDYGSGSAKHWAAFAYHTKNLLRAEEAGTPGQSFTGPLGIAAAATGYVELVSTAVLTALDATHTDPGDGSGSALKVVSSTTTGSGVRIGNTATGVTTYAPVIAGVVYSASAYVWGSAGTETLKIFIDWYQANGSASAITPTSTGTGFTATSAWVQYKEENRTAPSDAAYAVVRVVITGTTARTYWVAEAMLERATAATAWEGVAETIISPRASVTLPTRRCRITVVTPALESGADYQRLYYVSNSSDPGGASGSSQYLAVQSDTTLQTTNTTIQVKVSPDTTRPKPFNTGSFSATEGTIVSGSTDPSGTPFWKLGGAGTARFLGPTMQNQFHIYGEFMEPSAILGYSAGMQDGSSGTGAGVAAAASTLDHPGIARCTTGSTNAGTPLLRTTTSAIVLGLAKIRYSALVRIPTLSTGGETHFSCAGLADSGAMGALNSLATHNCVTYRANAGTWQISACNGSGTTITTGVTVVAGQWYFLEFEISADGLTINWWIDGGATASGTSTPGTMPSNTTPMAVFFGATKTNGTTNITCLDVDSLSLYGSFVD